VRTRRNKSHEISGLVRYPRRFVLIFSDILRTLGIEQCLQVPPFSKGRAGGIFLQATVVTADVDENETVAIVPYKGQISPVPSLKRRGDPDNYGMKPIPVLLRHKPARSRA
jgi:hypothetical protein